VRAAGVLAKGRMFDMPALDCVATGTSLLLSSLSDYYFFQSSLVIFSFLVCLKSVLCAIHCMMHIAVDSNPADAVMPCDNVILYKHFGTENVIQYLTVGVLDHTS
jgi:hypothetical protein